MGADEPTISHTSDHGRHDLDHGIAVQPARGQGDEESRQKKTAVEHYEEAFPNMVEDAKKKDSSLGNQLSASRGISNLAELLKAINFKIKTFDTTSRPDEGAHLGFEYAWNKSIISGVGLERILGT